MPQKTWNSRRNDDVVISSVVNALTNNKVNVKMQVA